MTNVNSNALPPAAPPAQAMMEESADPPTMKNAGKLSYEGGSDASAYALAALIFGLLAVGAMVQALMTNHGRTRRGLMLNILAGAVAGLLLVGSDAAGGGLDGSLLLVFAFSFGVGWAVLALLAFAVGSLVQPPTGIKRRA